MLSVPLLSASSNIYEYVEEHWAQLQSISSTMSDSIILWRIKLFSSFLSFFFFKAATNWSLPFMLWLFSFYKALW